MKASRLATISVMLGVVFVSLDYADAEYPFDSVPQLPPLAGSRGAGSYSPASSYDPALTVPMDNGSFAAPYAGPGYETPLMAPDYGPADYPGPAYGPSDYDEGDDGSWVGSIFERPFPFEAVFGPGVPVWVGYLASTYMPGTERTIWNGELFLPLWQDGRTLWFFNMRGQADDDDAGELNIGTGVRTLARPGLIFGTYLFYDRLFSANGNGFSQGTFGIEVMEVFWDYRFNVYFPESKGKPTSTPPTATISDGRIVVNSGEERAYWGFDFEGGALLGAWGPNAQHELRGFCGIYHFDSSAPGFDNITGPRARLEWRYYDIPMFGSGSRLTCGFTVQADTERGGDAFAFIGLRVPLDAWAYSRKPMSRLQRRMVDTIVRDVDVVSNTRSISEAAVNPQTGQQIDSIHVLNNDDNLAQLIPEFNENAVIVVDGGEGEFVSRSRIDLRTGQIVLGGGATTMVRGETTGRMARLTAPGTRPSVEFNGNHCPDGYLCAQIDYPPPEGFVMADKSTLSGIDIRGGQPAVVIDGVTNTKVSDVTIRDAGHAGIRINESNGVLVEDAAIDGTTITVTPPFGKLFITNESEHDHEGVGILSMNSHDVTLRRVRVKNTHDAGITFVGGHDIRVTDTRIDRTGRTGLRLWDTEDASLRWVDVKDFGLNDAESSRIELINSRRVRIDGRMASE